MWPGVPVWPGVPMWLRVQCGLSSGLGFHSHRLTYNFVTGWIVRNTPPINEQMGEMESENLTFCRHPGGSVKLKHLDHFRNHAESIHGVEQLAVVALTASLELKPPRPFAINKQCLRGALLNTTNCGSGSEA